MAFSISTRRGDTGQTDLLFGTRVTKTHPRIVALGDIDELNAALGWVRVFAQTAEAQALAPRVQLHLIHLMGEIATPPGKEQRYDETHPQQQLTEKEVEHLDALVEQLEREGKFEFKGWVLPGAAGKPAGAACDQARTTCRRAERSVLALSGTPDAVPNPAIVPYLNRLSDVLWLMARWEER